MALVLCIGRPCDPPVYNGFAFVEQDVTAENGQHLWSCEVPESEFGQFLIGEEGSPWFLVSDPRAKGKATEAADPFLPYAECKTKADLVALAKANLGLDLDGDAKRADLDAAVMAALALQPPPTA